MEVVRDPDYTGRDDDFAEETSLDIEQARTFRESLCVTCGDVASVHHQQHGYCTLSGCNCTQLELVRLNPSASIVRVKCAGGGRGSTSNTSRWPPPCGWRGMIWFGTHPHCPRCGGWIKLDDSADEYARYLMTEVHPIDREDAAGAIAGGDRGSQALGAQDARGAAGLEADDSGSSGPRQGGDAAVS